MESPAARRGGRAGRERLKCNAGLLARSRADRATLPARPDPGERVLHTRRPVQDGREGYLYFVSRKDDIIKSRGEKVSPREVENVVCHLEGVAEAAVVGVPDPMLGQAIRLVVVPHANAELTERDIRATASATWKTSCSPST